MKTRVSAAFGLPLACTALLLFLGCGTKTTSTGTPAADVTPSDDQTAADTTTDDAADTATGEISATECVALGQGECDASSECGSGKYCDPCTRKCLTERGLCDPCEFDVQCEKAALGSMCLTFLTGGSYCGRACLGQAGCPLDHECKKVAPQGEMQCVPKSGSCAPQSGACKTDGDCPFQTICNADYGKCVPGCTQDENCASPNVCSLGRCVAPCAEDADCKVLSADAVCKDLHCKIAGGCLSSVECETPETHCNLKDHKCVSGCAVDADCKDFALGCENGKCVKKGCDKNWQCSFSQVCNTVTRQCQAAEGPFCAVCNPDDENVPECGGKPNACFKMSDADDKEMGAFCGLVCGNDPAGACPQGWGCMELKDDKGTSQGKYCLRQCWSKPVGAP